MKNMPILTSLWHSLDPFIDVDKQTKDRFTQWYLNAKILQIRYVAYLTGSLYFVYLFAEFLIFRDGLSLSRMLIHGAVIPLLLFCVAFMSYKPASHRYMRYTLIFASLAAVFANISLNIWQENYAYYTPELYLNIIWIFAISGLVLSQASYTALFSIVIIFVFSLVAPLSFEFFILHSLWILAAFSFGFLSAFLVERMYKSLFLQQEQLQYLAQTDGLTTLYNRHTIEKILHEEIQKANENGEPLSVILLDIDFFKAINDTYGHTLGDTILQEFAKILKKNTQQRSSIGRFGGEEFFIVLPTSSAEEAYTLAENLREKIKAFSFTTIGEKTASFGVASYREGESFVELFNRADAALYEAKSYGRDCVKLF